MDSGTNQMKWYGRGAATSTAMAGDAGWLAFPGAEQNRLRAATPASTSSARPAIPLTTQAGKAERKAVGMVDRQTLHLGTNLSRNENGPPKTRWAVVHKCVRQKVPGPDYPRVRADACGTQPHGQQQQQHVGIAVQVCSCMSSLDTDVLANQFQRLDRHLEASISEACAIIRTCRGVSSWKRGGGVLQFFGCAETVSATATVCKLFHLRVIGGDQLHITHARW